MVGEADTIDTGAVGITGTGTEIVAGIEAGTIIEAGTMAGTTTGDGAPLAGTIAGMVATGTVAIEIESAGI